MTALEFWSLLAITGLVGLLYVFCWAVERMWREMDSDQENP